MDRKVICIQCPVGCDLDVSSKGDDYEVSGASVEDCKPGRKYAVAEVTAPRRVVTTTVRVLDGEFPLLSVRTDEPIPKDRILDCLRQLRQLQVPAPVQRGEVVVQGVAGTTSNILATRTVGFCSR